MGKRDRDFDKLQGHWLLAALGKKVLRPGGRALSNWMVDNAAIPGARVVELAPGLGVTAAEILHRNPASYTGIDEDLDAVSQAAAVVGNRGVIKQGRAQDTGLADASADLIIGEAMLTMQGDKTKGAILEEAARILAPGGRYAIHELALTPDDLPESTKDDLRKALARSIRVNARPLTVAEWIALFEEHGFEVTAHKVAPMGLLNPKQMLADEGVKGVATILGNLIRHPAARKRVLDMRSTFSAHKDELAAVSLIARRAG
ncbi:methyltransferase domain-containing protein [Corynebacterium sp. TAE3-ERU12]|uniref:class I SAM-dependent methyltransferase n=1 Tax=Corynebacterium sp. TAE3-ERU12 TaxID=2849491 RepID=UPI001C48C3F1|nr:class I SAM-dependent methyltransferase [Corynebacterium sp. TAE3-ERU12]MBV7295624.1 methyltransferase domain-containing protein [Corynebacterium sp. TAE3-ERU12]